MRIWIKIFFFRSNSIRSNFICIHILEKQMIGEKVSLPKNVSCYILFCFLCVWMKERKSFSIYWAVWDENCQLIEYFRMIHFSIKLTCYIPFCFQLIRNVYFVIPSTWTVSLTVCCLESGLYLAVSVLVPLYVPVLICNVKVLQKLWSGFKHCD